MIIILKKTRQIYMELGKVLVTVKNLWDFGQKCMDIRKVLGIVINIQGLADGNMWTLGRFSGS